MKLAATIVGSLEADLEAEMRRTEQALVAGVREGGERLKGELRRQVVSAGLGQRLARTWRDRVYPNQGHDAAALVWSKAPQIVRAFDEGAVIRSRKGLAQGARSAHWLAIPTPEAPKRGVGGKRISPSTFPAHRFGPLRFVYRPKGPSLLVIDGMVARGGNRGGFRMASTRKASRNRGAYVSTSGLTTVVMFFLVPQVRMPKRLDVARAAERWSARLPALILRRARGA